MTKTLIALATCALLAGAAIPMPGHGPPPEAAAGTDVAFAVHHHAIEAATNELTSQELEQINGASKDLWCGMAAGASLAIGLSGGGALPLVGGLLAVGGALCVLL